LDSFKVLLDKYADLCVRVGINIQKDQPLVISAPVEGVEFVRLLAKHAYEAGAKEVFVNWNDGDLTRMKFEYSPMEVFENFPKWYADCMEDYAEKGAGFISISAQDPYLLKGIDPKKIAANNKSSSIGLKKFREYTMNDINAWCVISIPTKKWAIRVFPDVNEEEAVEKLWDAIFKALRIYEEDPVEAWKKHLDNIESKVKFLNEKSFKKLYYKSSNGTDLEVELPEGHIWAGGGGKNTKGVYFVANMPTEEVFTMPHKYGVNGVVYSTKPLNYGGNLINNFSLTFKDGKVVDFTAEEGYEVLKDLLDLDEGAKRLGEVALVPFDSPISKSNIIFYNTLFDENASCHFALGKAYPTNIKGGSDMNEEELDKAGVNDSLTHVDFMVGTEDLNIVGETKEGEKVQIFENGNWAF